MVTARSISSAAEFSYCPLCGQEVQTSAFDVRKHKTNTKTTCPEHGELYIKNT